MSTRSHKADKIVQVSLILCTSELGEEQTPRQQAYNHQGHSESARKDGTHITTEVCN